MNCPRCDGPLLDEKERDGVTIDVCRQCRGVWLDRGELEKIIARASDDDDDDDDEHRWRGGPDGSQRPPRRRGWFENLGDLFD